MLPSRIWALVPAAGVGRRMGGEVPKQYLPLLDKTVIEHTLAKLAEVPEIEGIVVAISEEDGWWPTLDLAISKPIRTVVGGRERVHSVFNAVQAVMPELGDDDWLLVHDAARPCVRPADINHLIRKTRHHTCGGILAIPAYDTMKQASERQEIIKTVDRSQLWRALTPQIFRARSLYDALLAGQGYTEQITDEASALELVGDHPMLVEGRGDNLKITRPEDLAIAEFYLQQECKDGY